MKATFPIIAFCAVITLFPGKPESSGAQNGGNASTSGGSAPVGIPADRPRTGEVLSAPASAATSPAVQTPAPLAGRRDAVIFRNPEPLFCCYEASVFNTHDSPAGPLTQLEFAILTPGYRFEGAILGPWELTVSRDTLLSFNLPGFSELYPGERADAFHFCIAPPPGPPRPFSVIWTTKYQGLVISRDTIALRCGAPLPSSDLISFIPTSGCCATFSAVNGNSYANPVTTLRLELLSPNVSFSAGAESGPWTTRISLSWLQEYYSSTPLHPGEVLTGFRTCLESLTQQNETVRIAWSTGYEDIYFCTDTVTFACQPLRFCDVLNVQPANLGGQQACCFTMSLTNTHIPAGSLNSLRLRLLNTSVDFAPGAGGPWPASIQTAREILYSTASSPLGTGLTAGGFNFCFSGTPSAGERIRIQWESALDGTVVCRDTLSLECLNIQTCDSLRLSAAGPCVYDGTLENLHRPSTQLDGFRIRVTTPGATINITGTPPGWTALTQAAQEISWGAAGSGLPPDSVRSGFRFTLNPPAAGAPVELEWCTLRQGSVICCKNMPVQCVPDNPCDTLTTSPLPAACSYALRFRNTHLPATAVDGYRVNIVTPGASIAAVRPPAGWVLEQQGAVTFTLRDTAGVLPPGGTLSGLEADFIHAPGNRAVLFQWCSLLGGTVLCCNNGSVQCEADESRCDSLFLAPTANACTFDVGVANLHQPPSRLDGLQIELLTPGASIGDVITPDGWDITVKLPNRIYVRSTTGGLSPAGVVDSIRVSLFPPSGSGSIRLLWCTANAGSTICCDSALVECSVASLRDTVTAFPIADRPCCFSFDVANAHTPQSRINGVSLESVTPGVSIFTSQTQEPADWRRTASTTRVLWTALADGIDPGTHASGFALCFDNGASGNREFQVVWSTQFDGSIVDSDTLLFACDQTLDSKAPPFPRAVELRAAPNPFSSETTVEFLLPARTRATLLVANALGEIVARLAEGEFGPGVHRASLHAGDLPAGMYILHLVTADGTASAKVFRLR